MCVSTADCVPVLLYDTRKKVVAAIHAGWRGTVARIVEKTVSVMRDQYGSQGKDLIACIGQMCIRDRDYGIFTSAYGWFNVFAFMLIIGGIILYKMGVRFTGMGACLLMVLGCGLKYYAISTTFAEEMCIRDRY